MKLLAGPLALLTLVMLLSPPARADTAAAQTAVEFSAESSRLSNGSPDWQEQSIQISRRQGQRDVKALSLTRTRRFGLDDQQIGGLYSTPLNDRLTGTLNASVSPSHRVLPAYELGAAIQYEFAPAWLIHTGLAGKRYDSADVAQASLVLEHYFSSFSVSGAWRPVRTRGLASSSRELRGSYYYSDTSFVGVIVSAGQEATPVDADTVLLADVRASALVGRHRLSRQWALQYALSSTRQGSFYNRKSVRLGAEYFF